MSPYERQIDPLEAVDLTYVRGVPGQAKPSADETLERLVTTPPSVQRLADTAGAGGKALALWPNIGRLERGPRLAAITAGLALVVGLGAAVSVTALGGGDGPSAGQIARANGGATAQVLAQDLGVGMGAYAVGGLPVTLTNTADGPLSYNVTVEAQDAAGRRVTADVAFVGTLAAGQSTVVTLFATASKSTAAALAEATFRVVEASSY